jgi:hypothetical protein
MFYRGNLIAMMVVILGLVMFVPVAQAERQEIEGISCASNTHTPVQATPDVIYIGSFEGKGIFRSTHKNKVNDNNTIQQVGIVKASAALGGFFWNGLYKSMSTDGDYGIWEFSGDTKSGSTSKLIYGTGKYKDAKGELKTKQITTGKPIVQGTEQVCQQVVGWIEFAK